MHLMVRWAKVSKSGSTSGRAVDRLTPVAGANSVALGFASRRRSHVRRHRMVQHDLGAPLISLNVLTGHRSWP